MPSKLTALVIAGAVAAAAQPALAKESPIKNHSPTKVEGKCNTDGGTYFNNGTTYACLYTNGSVIVCGGVTPHQKQTCYESSARPNVRPFHLPTRGQIEAGKY